MPRERHPVRNRRGPGDAVVGIRRSTLAARLRAIYGDVDEVDAFVGMVSEKHVAGAEFGPLQLAIRKKQFQARSGTVIASSTSTTRQTYGITYRQTLAELINLDAGVTVQPSVFKAG